MQRREFAARGRRDLAIPTSELTLNSTIPRLSSKCAELSVATSLLGAEAPCGRAPAQRKRSPSARLEPRERSPDCAEAVKPGTSAAVRLTARANASACAFVTTLVAGAPASSRAPRDVCAWPPHALRRATASAIASGGITRGIASGLCQSGSCAQKARVR